MNGDLASVVGRRCSQADFAELVGISEARVSQMLAEGALEPGLTAHQWLIAYSTRLREQAAGRDANGVLAQERAALTRSQKLGQDIKNAIAQGEYAPIGLLGDVLAAASAAVVDRFDGLMPLLRKACPEMTAEQRDVVAKVIASARNEWVRSTAELVVRQLDALDDQAEADAEIDPYGDDVLHLGLPDAELRP